MADVCLLVQPLQSFEGILADSPLEVQPARESLDGGQIMVACLDADAAAEDVLQGLNGRPWVASGLALGPSLRAFPAEQRDKAWSS